MRLSWVVILLVTAAMTAATADRIDGTWKVRFAGPPEHAPKTVGLIVLDLKVDLDAVTGLARIGVWPGDAPIADGKINGDHISFNATGHLGSTTGIPTCHFEAMIHGDGMDLTMTAIRNPGGPLGAGMVYNYSGQREPE